MSTKLSDILQVFAPPQLNDSFRVQKPHSLKLNFRNISTIDKLTPLQLDFYGNITELSLNHNKLTSLIGLSQFKNLQKLSINNNCIDNLSLELQQNIIKPRLITELSISQNLGKSPSITFLKDSFINLKILNGQKVSEGYFHEDVQSSSSSSCFSQGWIYKQEPLNAEKKRWQPLRESPENEKYRKQIFGMVEGPIKVFENRKKKRRSEASAQSRSANSNNVISPERDLMLSPESEISQERSGPLRKKTPDSLKISASSQVLKSSQRRPQEFKFSHEIEENRPLRSEYQLTSHDRQTGSFQRNQFRSESREFRSGSQENRSRELQDFRLSSKEIKNSRAREDYRSGEREIQDHRLGARELQDYRPGARERSETRNVLQGAVQDYHHVSKNNVQDYSYRQISNEYRITQQDHRLREPAILPPIYPPPSSRPLTFAEEIVSLEMQNQRDPLKMTFEQEKRYYKELQSNLIKVPKQQIQEPQSADLPRQMAPEVSAFVPESFGGKSPDTDRLLQDSDKLSLRELYPDEEIKNQLGETQQARIQYEQYLHEKNQLLEKLNQMQQQYNQLSDNSQNGMSGDAPRGRIYSDENASPLRKSFVSEQSNLVDKIQNVLRNSKDNLKSPDREIEWGANQPPMIIHNNYEADSSIPSPIQGVTQTLEPFEYVDMFINKRKMTFLLQIFYQWRSIAKMGLNKTESPLELRPQVISSQGILKKQNYFTFSQRDTNILRKILQKKIQITRQNDLRFSFAQWYRFSLYKKMKHLEMLRDTPSMFQEHMFIDEKPSPMREVNEDPSPDSRHLRRNTISHSQENLHNSAILQNIEKLKFKYDGYISDNQKRPPLPAKKVMFKLSPKNYQILSRSPTYSAASSQKIVVPSKSSKKGDRQIKNLLIHKNEGLLKKIMREWHLYTLRAFKKRIMEKMKKKSPKPNKLKKPKKSRSRLAETDDQQSDSRSINIQIKNKSFEKTKKAKNYLKDTSLKSSMKQWNLPHNKFNYPHIPVQKRELANVSSQNKKMVRQRSASLRKSQEKIVSKAKIIGKFM